MYQSLQNLISNNIPEFLNQYLSLLTITATLSIILLTGILVYFFLHKIIYKLINKMSPSYANTWKRLFFKQKLFKRSAWLIQGIVLYGQASLWIENGTTQYIVQLVAQIWSITFGLLFIFALLDGILEISNGTKFEKLLPLKGIFQGIKLLATIFALITMISLLVGKSPLLIISGLGAMTAVILFVFKDPILGLVAGIQLSTNKMVNKGDWIEMSKYGASGNVIEIGLTTVKVRNFDNTIVTIPTYSLISDSFTNWRGMQESGGRRIMRSILIDVNSVGFLSEDIIIKLNESRNLNHYINDKLKNIQEHELLYPIKSDIDKRKLTNLGTFRAYLVNYLKQHSGIHQDMTLMVRQLEPNEHGIPLEIYAFTNTVDWTEYEGIQSDIFDHVYAVLPSFSLRAFQSPTGSDFNKM